MNADPRTNGKVIVPTLGQEGQQLLRDVRLLAAGVLPPLPKLEEPDPTITSVPTGTVTDLAGGSERWRSRSIPRRSAKREQQGRALLEAVRQMREREARQREWLREQVAKGLAERDEEQRQRDEEAEREQREGR